MTRRSLQLASMQHLDLQPLVGGAGLAAIQLNAPTARTSGLQVHAPAVANLPVIALRQQYLGMREIGNMPALPKTGRFPVGSPDETRSDVALPFGVPQRVRAGLLKLLAGGRRSDQMLELRGDAWDFVSDDTLVDLKDLSRVFRVGRALIHS
jgi:hypothetical protein